MNQSRKEREREFRRTEILNAAVEIFAAKGFTHTTLDDIAEASEFGKGTLYNYFQNKEDLYSAIIENIFEQFISNLKKIHSGTTTLQEFFGEVANFILSFCIENRSAFMLLAHKRMGTIHEDPVSISEKLKNLFKEAHSIQVNKIKLAIKNREIRNLDPEKLATLIRGVIFSYAHHQMACKKDKNFDAKKESEYLVSILFNGILEKKQEKF